MKKLLGFSCVGLLALAATACGASNHSGNQAAETNTTTNIASHLSGSLSVLYAGSMTANIENDVKPAFEKETGVSFEGEGAGSSQLAQEIKSGLRTPDIFISASPSVNNKILMGSANHNKVQWYLTFARDQLVIAYNPKSKFADQLQAAQKDKTPWYNVLQEKGFLLGRTDPKLDPKGASTVLMFDLAAKYYHQPSLANTLMGGSIENPSQVFPEESLLARLTSGQMDAIIAYKHEAVNWKVPYITLPNAINLGDPSMSKEYSTVSVSTGTGKTTKGAPIVFTVAIPNTVKNEAAAEAFVKYIASGAGHELLMQEGFTPIPIELGGSKSLVPASLQSLIQGNYQ